MKTIKPLLLSHDPLVRVIAPSCSGATISQDVLARAAQVLCKAGLRISYGKNFKKLNRFESSSIRDRLHDLHEAFSDPEVDITLAVRGGYNSNDLLDYVDWDLIKNNPKVYCGYSDNTALQNAILARTGLITYSGPNFSTFGNQGSGQYTLNAFLQAISMESFELGTTDAVRVLRPGKAKGRIVGGNLCTLNLLQGTKYFPDLRDTILFLEDDHISSLDWWEFCRNLQSLMHLPDFAKVQGIVFGKFQDKSNLPPQRIAQILRTKQGLYNIPIIASMNFGHTLPMLTFPIGGKVSLDARANQVTITVIP